MGLHLIASMGNILIIQIPVLIGLVSVRAPLSNLTNLLAHRETTEYLVYGILKTLIAEVMNSPPPSPTIFLFWRCCYFDLFCQS